MIKVIDYAYRDISSVSENSSIKRVIRTMVLHRIRAVPVINELGEYIGCISESDILEASIPAYMKSIQNTSFMADLDSITTQLKSILDEKAIDYIDREYPTVSPNDTMSYAADQLYRTHRTILPVVENKTLYGLISNIDILSVSLKRKINII